MAKFENTGVLYTDEVLSLMRPELEIALNEADLDPRVSGTVLDVLGFVQLPTRLPQGVVTSRGGVLALPEIDENGERPKMNYKNGDEKGYKVKMYGGSYSITKLATKTIRDSGLDMSLFDPSVQEQLSNLGNSVRELGMSAKMTREDEATKLLVKGFGKTSSYGAGSPAPDGEALFSAAHKSGDNLMTGAEALFSQENLVKATKKLEDIKNDVGARYKIPGEFLLVTGVKQRESVFNALNNSSDYAASVADVQVQNGVTMNLFTSTEGYKVKHLILETIGQPDSKGEEIGNGLEWFVMDPERLRAAKALRLYTLWNPELDNYIDQKTKEFTIDIDLAFTVEHVKAEIGIVGSTGINA